MTLSKPHFELVALLDRYRKIINRRATDRLNPHFHLDKVNFKVVSRLYNDHLPSSIANAFKHLTDIEFDELPISDGVHINIYSDLFVVHPLVDRFNTLSHERIAGTITDSEYYSRINELKTAISEDFKDRFRSAILITPLSKSMLTANVDTLLFVTLFFYNKLWDPLSTTFNGPVAITNNLTDLKEEYKPDYYKSLQAAQLISSLAYDYYKRGTPASSLNIVVRSKDHKTKNPLMISWIVDTILQNVREGNYPIGFGTYFQPLQSILNSCSSQSEELLQKLVKFNETEPPTFIDEKRKAVKEFCLAIHKIFSYFLQLPTSSFDNKRLKMYHNILLAFEMDNFYNAMRERLDSQSQFKRDVATDRLGDLLRGV